MAANHRAQEKKGQGALKRTGRTAKPEQPVQSEPASLHASGNAEAKPVLWFVGMYLDQPRSFDKPILVTRLYNDLTLEAAETIATERNRSIGHEVVDGEIRRNAHNRHFFMVDEMGGSK